MAALKCSGQLVVAIVSLSLLAISSSVSSFPSLFGRSLLFQRGSQASAANHPPSLQQQQQQQHQQQQVQAQLQLKPQAQDSLFMAANSIAPNTLDALGLDQDDLLRLQGGHQHQQPLRRHYPISQQHNFAAAPSHFAHAYFKPAPQVGQHNANQRQMVVGGHQFSGHQQHQQQQQQSAAAAAAAAAFSGLPSFGPVPTPVASLEEPSGAGGRQQVAYDESPGASMLAGQQQQQQQPQGLTPSQSEVVDKIEQHIGDQIEQGLGAGGQMEQQRPAASNYQSRNGDKEAGAATATAAAAATGSGEGESAESEYEAADGASEKRSHESHEQKEPSEHYHHQHQHHQHQHHHNDHHDHHHGHNDKNAFEVHHKKGGKSFQYFQMGHHHHRR